MDQGVEIMSTARNPLYILEAAKNIVAKEKQPTNDKPINPKLSLVNEEIKRIKEFVEKRKVNKSFMDIGSFKENLHEKKLVEKGELLNVHNLGNLLELLQSKRKSLKEDASPSESREKVDSGSFTQDLFIGSSQYTIRSLCNEFSCSFDNITPTFVEKKKDLCCTKLTYLLSKYDYCDSLTKSIDDVNGRFNIKYGKDDIPIFDKKNKIDFDTVSKTVEKVTYNDPPDFELNRMLLGSLSLFRDNIVKDIDNYCNKIDLANNFLSSMEKSRKIDFC